MYICLYNQPFGGSCVCYLYYVRFQENLQKWLTDEKARDQLVIRSGPDTEVLWNDPRQKKPEPVHKRPVSY